MGLSKLNMSLNGQKKEHEFYLYNTGIFNLCHDSTQKSNRIKKKS